MTFSPELLQAAEALLAACRARGWTLTTAEACTGGLISGLLTEIPGSSDVVECGYVTYSNQAKAAMLGVPAAILESAGAVSKETALAMATGAGVGAAAAMGAGDVLLAVGATVILIEVGLLILEMAVIAGAIYFWPEYETEPL